MQWGQYTLCTETLEQRGRAKQSQNETADCSVTGKEEVKIQEKEGHAMLVINESKLVFGLFNKDKMLSL